MMKNLFLILFFTISLFSCNSDDESVIPGIPCEVDNWGHLQIKNKLGEAFQINSIHFDGVLQNDESIILEAIPAGEFQLTAYEIDYILDQDVFTYTITVLKCNNNNAELY